MGAQSSTAQKLIDVEKRVLAEQDAPLLTDAALVTEVLVLCSNLFKSLEWENQAMFNNGFASSAKIGTLIITFEDCEGSFSTFETPNISISVEDLSTGADGLSVYGIRRTLIPNVDTGGPKVAVDEIMGVLRNGSIQFIDIAFDYSVILTLIKEALTNEGHVKSSPLEARSLRDRATSAIAACDKFLPGGMKPVTVEMESEDRVTMTANNAVEISYYETTNTLNINDFFFYMKPDKTQELKRSVESADPTRSLAGMIMEWIKHGPQRTLAGMAMEWIKHVAMALGASKVTLHDCWFGKDESGAIITSKDLKFLPDQRDFRARKHAWWKSDRQRLSDRLNEGFYAMWGFEYDESDAARPCRGAEVRPDALDVLRRPFVDLA